MSKFMVGRILHAEGFVRRSVSDRVESFQEFKMPDCDPISPIKPSNHIVWELQKIGETRFSFYKPLLL